jgi:uncharacterized membrane protein
MVAIRPWMLLASPTGFIRFTFLNGYGDDLGCIAGVMIPSVPRIEQLRIVHRFWHRPVTVLGTEYTISTMDTDVLGGNTA